MNDNSSYYSNTNNSKLIESLDKKGNIVYNYSLLAPYAVSGTDRILNEIIIPNKTYRGEVVDAGEIFGKELVEWNTK